MKRTKPVSRGFVSDTITYTGWSKYATLRLRPTGLSYYSYISYARFDSLQTLLATCMRPNVLRPGTKGSFLWQTVLYFVFVGALLDVVDECADRMGKNRHIPTTAESIWLPVWIVAKAGGKPRCCVVYRWTIYIWFEKRDQCQTLIHTKIQSVVPSA